jgi:uncharacterized membrane protein YeaQ/YmgE (transglycosylase-associated protein family)
VRIVSDVMIGVVAQCIMPGRAPGGLIGPIVLGMVGARRGGGLEQAQSLSAPGEPAGCFLAVIGAIMVLLLFRRLLGRRPRVEGMRTTQGVHPRETPED